MNWLADLIRGAHPAERAILVIAVCWLVSLALSGCAPPYEFESTLNKKDHKVNGSTITEFWLPDGTRCVRVSSSIVCEWRAK